MRTSWDKEISLVLILQFASLTVARALVKWKYICLKFLHGFSSWKKKKAS